MKKIDKLWERYFDKTNYLNEFVVNRIDWFIKNIYGEKILDIGCSNGLLIYLLSQINSYELHGIDICKESIENAIINNKNNIGKNVFLKIKDAENLDYNNNYFDCVVMGEVLEHVNNQNIVLEQVKRVLKKFGILLLSIPDNGKLSVNHKRSYTDKSIKEIIESFGFVIHELLYMKSGMSENWICLKAIKHE